MKLAIYIDSENEQAIEAGIHCADMYGFQESEIFNDTLFEKRLCNERPELKRLNELIQKGKIDGIFLPESNSTMTKAFRCSALTELLKTNEIRVFNTGGEIEFCEKLFVLNVVMKPGVQHNNI